MLLNTSGYWAIYCNQEILWNLNPLLSSSQIWIYDNLQNVSKPYLTQVDIIWMCLDACKLHSSTKWPINPMSLDIHHFYNFRSITNSAWISWVFPSRFHVNRCRTRWDIGNSSKTSQNRTFSIRAFGTANCCKPERIPWRIFSSRTSKTAIRPTGASIEMGRIIWTSAR